MKFTLKEGDCGFGFYHLDLLLEQARLQMVGKEKRVMLLFGPENMIPFFRAD